jgi:glycosyltransferase involved in cell wall biosynthesis
LALQRELPLRLLITIPVFNERRYVEQVLAKVLRFHDQILFIDDGSTDGTAELLEGIVHRSERVNAGTHSQDRSKNHSHHAGIHLLRHPVNRGYGQSIIDAFGYAHRHHFDWVITMDCDEQHEPEMIPKFISEIQSDRWDVISGSRYLENLPGDDLPPGDRRAINAAITSLMNGLFNLGITDAFCGFKAHRVSAMIPLALDQTGYAFPLQLWPRLAQAKLRLTEIPVRLIYNDPNRHFGGALDDAGNRLRHYLDVLHGELHRAAPHRDENASTDDPSGDATGESFREPNAVSAPLRSTCSCC